MKYYPFKMKNIFVAMALVCTVSVAQAQEDLHKQTFSVLSEQGLDAAIKFIDKNLKSQPDNYSLLIDKAFISNLNRDYGTATTIGKQLIKRTDADEQAFLILGAAYDSIASAKEAQEVYRKGLELFPASGLIYAQYGNSLYLAGNTAEAVHTLEKGVQADPNISSNYYTLAKLYAQQGNPLWAVLYGEIFVNLESLSVRTDEIRKLVLNQYTALFAAATLTKYAKSSNAFESVVANTFAKFAGTVSYAVNPETLIAVRGQFIVDWYENETYKQYPFRLFDRERQLLKQGDFEAYNQWLFSVNNPAAFKNWANTHPDEIKSFERYQRNVLLRPLKTEYYK